MSFSVPYLYEEAFQWYESFDELGELLTKPNPTAILDRLEKTIASLIDKCSWPAERIHLFGFAQGGSVATELGLRWWRRKKSLGSIVSVEGPLLSYPTLDVGCPTPLLFFHHSAPPNELAAMRKGYVDVKEVKVPGGPGMPRSKTDWVGIMTFWGRVLGMRQEMEGLHPVISGGPAVPTLE